MMKLSVSGRSYINNQSTEVQLVGGLQDYFSQWRGLIHDECFSQQGSLDILKSMAVLHMMNLSVSGRSVS